MPDKQTRCGCYHAQEVDWLREELAEWKAAHQDVVRLRELIESHMDMAHGEWQCVAEFRRLREVAEELNRTDDDGLLGIMPTG